MPLSFAFNAGRVTASVNQDSLVHDALKPLQAGQRRCWLLPERLVLGQQHLQTASFAAESSAASTLCHQCQQGECHSVMHLSQTWKPAQQQIAFRGQCMPMGLVSCTLQDLLDHCCLKHSTILLVSCYQIAGQPCTAQHDMQQTPAEKQ